tara:strand:- start:1502 stop:1666 length:165 start_codon:yes stop_codon:yes gene_type:complete
MEKGDAKFLDKLVDSLEEAGERLEIAYRDNNKEDFHRVKRFILQIQDKIAEVVK